MEERRRPGASPPIDPCTFQITLTSEEVLAPPMKFPVRPNNKINSPEDILIR